jgi:hypothetical protein
MDVAAESLLNRVRCGGPPIVLCQGRAVYAAPGKSFISFELNIFDDGRGVRAGDAHSPLRFFGVQWYPYGPFPF